MRRLPGRPLTTARIASPPGSPPARVDAVLFDADGVLQSPTVRWRAALAAHAGRSADDEALGGLAAALLRLEADHLTGERDFEGALVRLLTEVDDRASVGLDAPAVLRIFNAIDPDPQVLAVVAALRRQGYRCCLASNQQPHRADHMSRALGYRALFDQEFYSCRLGAAKPDGRFFARVVDRLKVPADRIFFVDDRAENVHAARGAGLQAERFERSQGVDTLRRLLTMNGIRVP